MEKIIIGIHGIGNKPPPKFLQAWWMDAILEGLKKYNYPARDFDFELVYWEDILHETPLNPEQNDWRKPDFIQEKYVPEENGVEREPIDFKQKAIDYLGRYYDKLIASGVLLLKNQTITELFIHLHMKDLERYYSKTTVDIDGNRKLVRDAIIERLINTLNKHRHKNILLIAHSMGSLITQDTLIEKTPGIKIDTLVTMGSPLGQKYVIDNYKNEKKENSINKLRVPENIRKHWYNFSDIEDLLALNYSIANYYEKNSNNLGITDKIVRNNYAYNGNRNPHKSFGYLRTPEVAEIINAFVWSGMTGMLARIKEGLAKIFRTGNRC